MRSNPYQQRIMEGEALFAAGDFARALHVFEEVLSADPANGDALNDAGLTSAALEDVPRAADFFERALRVDPSHANAFFGLMDLLARVGDVELIVEAYGHYEGGIPNTEEKRRYRDVILGSGDGQNVSLTAYLNPSAAQGAHYGILETIHAELRPRTYVEIGVGQGISMALADDETTCVGIDPYLNIQVPLPLEVKLFALPSDTFFDGHDLRRELGHCPVDVAFLDGEPAFEQALRDFIQIERQSMPGSLVLVNGCYASDGAAAGDLWKLVLCLKKYRPDLSVHTVDVAPAGLAVITNLNPSSTTLAEREAEIRRAFQVIGPGVLARDKAAQLNRVEGDRSTLLRLLPAPYAH